MAPLAVHAPIVANLFLFLAQSEASAHDLRRPTALADPLIKMPGLRPASNAQTAITRTTIVLASEAETGLGIGSQAKRTRFR